jgi:hypothetical protein
MNMTKSSFYLLCLALVLMTACEDDFELNADYKRQPVVYGVIDPGAEKQIFMINHTFLGDGSAFDYALIEDSALYDNLEARIFWDEGSVLLEPEIIDTKDDDIAGLFYAPEQTVYSAPTSAFNFGANSTDTYRLGAIGDGDTIFAETTQIIIVNSDLRAPSSNQTLNFVSNSSNVFTNPVYTELNIEYKFVKDALKHNVRVRLLFNEVRNDGTMTEKFAEFEVKKLLATDDDGTTIGEESFPYSGEAFFQSIANNVDVDPNVNYREILGVEFLYSAFGTELSKYLDIVNPTGGVGQETPSYSNINGGEAHGILSAKATLSRIIPVDKISGKTFEELVFGQFTGDLKFCNTQEGFNCE